MKSEKRNHDKGHLKKNKKSSGNAALNKSMEKPSAIIWLTVLVIYAPVALVIWGLEYFSQAKMGFMRYVVFMNGELASSVLSPTFLAIWTGILLVVMGYFLLAHKINVVERFLASTGCALAAVALNTPLFENFKATGFIKLLLLLAAVIFVVRVWWVNKK